MEAAQQRRVIYDTKVNVQSPINLTFVLPGKVSWCAKTSVIKTGKADSTLEMSLSERNFKQLMINACLLIN